jgi:hypothetical protein
MLNQKVLMLCFREANERRSIFSGIIGSSADPIATAFDKAVRSLFGEVFVQELRDLLVHPASTGTPGYAEASFVQSFFSN